jgi:hypothetical protein
MRIFKIKYMRTLISSFQNNEASVLEHIAPIYLPIYSVVAVLHARVIESTPIIWLTRIVLSFLKALEVFWVVIIGLEFLSLA